MHKTVFCGLLLAGLAARAADFTMTGGTAFSSGTWDNDAAPSLGGAADAALTLDLGDGWAVENDLGASGWFTLNALAFPNDAAGTLSGDGLAFGGTDPALTFGLDNAIMRVDNPIRLDAATVFNGYGQAHLYGEVSGNGDLVLNWDSAENQQAKALYLHGSRTGSGATVIRAGILRPDSLASLGTGPVRFEGGEQTYKRLYLMGVTGTVPNDFTLCPETDNRNFEECLHVNSGGETHFTGHFTFRNSKIFVPDNNRIYFDGEFTPAESGNYLVFCSFGGNSHTYVTRPLDIDGNLFAGWNGRLHLTAADNRFATLGLFDSAQVVCDADHAFPDGHNYGAYTGSTGTIDLNGHSQIFGNSTPWGNAGESTIIFRNSDLSAVPSLTLRATEERKNSRLYFQGPMNVTKEGDALLMNLSPASIDGDLTVTAGALKFMESPGAGARLAKKITVTGGALDLGGHVWRCDELTMTGGCLQNGVLLCGTATVGAGATCHAELAGEVVRSASGDVRQMIPPAAQGAQYTLPADVVVYYPFDTEDSMFVDFGLGGATLAVAGNGNDPAPAFSADGRHGGCLEMKGGRFLETYSYPAAMPKGEEPYTVIAWVKRNGGADTGGWIGYGAYETAEGNSFRLLGGDAIQNYWNNRDVNVDMAGIGNGEWHQVVGTWDGTTRRLYFDGELAGEYSDLRPNTGTGTLQIGRTLWDASFTGWIDDVMVLRRAMTADEVAATFEAENGFAADPQPTHIKAAAGTVELQVHSQAVCYHFDSAETLFEDATGNGATLTYAEGAGASCDLNDTPGGAANGGALKLDGSTYLQALNGFPESMPTGNAPYTVCAFVKLDPGSNNQGGWFSYGKMETARGNSFHADGSMTRFENYWNNTDMHDDLPYRDGVRVSFDDGWHSIVCVFMGGPGGRRIHYFDGEFWIAWEWMWYPDIANELYLVGKTMWSAIMGGHVDELTVYNYALTPAEVRAYHDNRRPPAPSTSYPADLAVEVAADATVKVPAEVALHNLCGQGTVAGDATLADGAELAADAGAVTVTGTLTFAGTGTVTLPEEDAGGGWTLFRAGAVSGDANLAGWTVKNVPRGHHAYVSVRANGEVVVRNVANGFSVLVR